MKRKPSVTNFTYISTNKTLQKISEWTNLLSLLFKRKRENFVFKVYKQKNLYLWKIKNYIVSFCAVFFDFSISKFLLPLTHSHCRFFRLFCLFGLFFMTNRDRTQIHNFWRVFQDEVDFYSRSSGDYYNIGIKKRSSRIFSFYLNIDFGKVYYSVV